MKICIIGKIPPVQGGTPKETISFAYHLAKAGHQINVVTNALEVEPEYRIFTMDYFETCGQEARSPFKEANLKIHYTGIDRQHRFIPYNNPSVSKLANLAKEVIEKYNCELIYAIYLEPYGVVASLVSSWTKIPYVVQHAGSDIGRLFHSKKLNNTYCEVFQNASAIITNKKHIAAYLEHNISLDKIYPQPITCSFDDSQKNVMRLDLNKYIGFLKTIEHPYLVKYFKYFLEKQIDTKIPIIGIYGKTGEMKGHFDLVKALGDLKKNGAKFNLVGLIQGPEYNLRKLILLLKEYNFLDRTWLLPYIPHWHIGSFFKA
ncbi:MAG: glycosyltransferase, partial [Gammaproteobacteria bacterium]